MDSFYQDLEPMHSLRDLHDLSHYIDVPDTWYVALSDVRGSTEAIAKGKYKAINSVAAASICGMLNAIPDIEVPFVFGGDGASILIPPQSVAIAKAVLSDTRALAKQAFDLDLRVGIVPVQAVVRAGHRLQVAKLHLSDNYQQAIFTGGGLSYAEDLLKAPDHNTDFDVTEDDTVHQADFSGYECRWNAMPAQHSEVVSLLVQAQANTTQQRHDIYRDVLGTIDMIYGDTVQRHPFKVDKMRVNTNPLDYSVEKGLRPASGNRWWDGLRLMFWAILGYLKWRFVDKIWGDYRQVVYESTDHEKFDDVLRMTISGDETQRQTLERYLEVKHEQGYLVYGVHISDASLMTCIVFDRFGRQVHFVDGTNGGYAQAASYLKKQIKEAQTTAAA